MAKNKYWTSDRIRAEGCPISIIFSLRSAGKSFDIFKNAVTNYWDSDGQRQSALIRRCEEDISHGRAAEMGNTLVCDGNGVNQVSKITGGQWTTIFYRSRRWYLARWDEEINKRIVDERPFMFCFLLTEAESDKGASFPNVDEIHFDEFIAMGAYLRNEYMLFNNTLSTIVRNRGNVRVFLYGNSISMYNVPYFDEMGLTNIKNMKPGDLDVYRYGDSETRVAVEYARVDRASKPASNKFFAFDNPQLKMITGGDSGGEWSIPSHPHLPHPYDSRDVLFSFYILFAGDTIRGDVIGDDSGVYIYMVGRVPEVPRPEEDLIYTSEPSAARNYARSVYETRGRARALIAMLFREKRVFYADNPLGEEVASYLANTI